ncbi:Protein N-acetyltransferase, RimJ/RimL family [Butyrivibrio sp. Su6]|uniref:GNAT family N-acetyltransferase n=1 Tax=Butyrivibrio sp. Su6 TaxID=1520810 RepID=UPI00089E29D6|nr:GNAT family protein [Butyrivibrio sp. Su6]SEF85050.1 Protein N-acetyltransferase, RimJ/RimL family [Butyrivibrio sp. Su6]
MRIGNSVIGKVIETDRLIIRDIELPDGEAFIHMALDGSLNDVGFGKDCSYWMDDWIIEAQNLAREDDPRKNYLAYVIEDKITGSPAGAVGCTFYEDLEKVGITYFIGADFRNNGYASEAIKAYVCYFFEHYDENEIIATIREDNLPSWKTIERVGFSLTEKKMYRDINDAKEKLYRFYLAQRNQQF